MFLINNHITVDAFADSILLLTLGTMIANRLTILIRSRRQDVSPSPRAATAVEN